MATFPSPQSYLASLGGGLPDPAYSPPAVGDYITGGYHDFDGVDDHITFPALAGLELTPSSVFTLSIWVYSGTTANLGAISYGDAGGLGGWTFRRWGNSWGLIFIDASGNQYMRSVNSGANNQWQHYLVVSDGSAINIYANATFQTPSTYLSPVTPTYSASSRLVVGAYPTPQNYHIGSVAEIAVWSTDQSANVAAIYNSRARHNLMNLATPPDVFYAPLTIYGDNPDGTVGAVFEAVSGNDGTGVNMDAVDAILPVDSVTSTRVKVLDLATSTVTTTDTLNVLTSTGGTGSSFP